MAPRLCSEFRVNLQEARVPERLRGHVQVVMEIFSARVRVSSRAFFFCFCFCWLRRARWPARVSAFGERFECNTSCQIHPLLAMPAKRRQQCHEDSVGMPRYSNTSIDCGVPTVARPSIV